MKDGSAWRMCNLLREYVQRVADETGTYGKRPSYPQPALHFRGDGCIGARHFASAKYINNFFFNRNINVICNKLSYSLYKHHVFQKSHLQTHKTK